MSLSPPILICTRFGLAVKDRAWFAHRLALISAITAPSLLAQRDQSFRWALFVDRDLPADVYDALARILEPFAGRAFIHADSTHTSPNVLALAKDRGLVNDSGYVLTARIDDDDAWSVKTVGTVRSHVDRWLAADHDSAGLGVTFATGFEWVMYDMLDIDQLQRNRQKIIQAAGLRPFDFPFHSMSVFVLSKPVDGGMSAISTSHPQMNALLTDNRYTVEILASGIPMWLYCRHKQAATGLRKAQVDEVDLSLDDLAVEFGIDREQTATYLQTTDDYGYSVIKRTDSGLSDIMKDLNRVRRELAGAAAESERATQLRQAETQLSQRLTYMSENVVGEPNLDSLD